MPARRAGLCCTTRASRPASAVGVSSNVRPHREAAFALHYRQRVDPNAAAGTSVTLKREICLMSAAQTSAAKPMNRVVIAAACLTWLATMGLAHLRPTRPDTIDWILWLFTAYVARFVVLRLHGRPASLGAARVDDAMPKGIRHIVELTSVVFLVWAWWSIGSGAA